MLKGLKYLYHFCVLIVRRFIEYDCSLRAASLAYSTLLSFVPLLMVAFIIASQFTYFVGTERVIKDFILANFVAESANVISAQIDKFMGHIKELTWTNIISLVLVSTLLIFNIVHAFNAIWQVKMKRHMALSFMIYLLVLISSPILIGIFIFASSYLATLPLWSKWGVRIFFNKPLLFVFPYIIAFVTFTLLNWVLPSCKVRFIHAAIAGFVTTIFFELIKYGFSLYLVYFPTYRLIYGALAAIPIFLIWLYMAWCVILGGAIVCQTLSRRYP